MSALFIILGITVIVCLELNRKKLVNTHYCNEENNIKNEEKENG